MSISKGYECEFIDSVVDDLFCKKCDLVARRLTITECCGESFCYACITDVQKQDEPCPECGEKNFTTFKHVKNQKRINSLCVYCSMKERGCDWSGTLVQLDTHLDPDLDNCQYVDTKCPLHCHMTIPKNKVEQHVALHCTKRPYVCQHCNFKATYEEVVDKHVAECKYVPLQCPNMCGVTFERDFIEDHMKMCRLEEVACEFRGVGCEDYFTRENQQEHARQNSHKHLTLTASLAVETKEWLQQKLIEQDKWYKEEMEKLKDEMIQEHKRKMEEQLKIIQEEKLKADKLHNNVQHCMQVEKELEQKISNQEKNIEEQQRKLVHQTKILNGLEKLYEEEKKKSKEQKIMLEEQNLKLEAVGKNLIDQVNRQMKNEQNIKEKEQQKNLLEQQFNSKLQKLEQLLQEVTAKSFQNEINFFKMLPNSPNQFSMTNFSHEKAKDKIKDWRSSAMWTCGYKFCIGVDANGYRGGRGKCIWVELRPMSGEFDDQLTWPAKAKFTVEIINQQEGENARHSRIVEWKRPTSEYGSVYFFPRVIDGFVEHSQLHNFLKNDTLYFEVSVVKL